MTLREVQRDIVLEPLSAGSRESCDAPLLGCAGHFVAADRLGVTDSTPVRPESLGPALFFGIFW
jgi:hypothetical protein